MKTELPAPEEYYRLTRARELRKKAGRLDRCASLLATLLTLGWIPLFVVCCLVQSPLLLLPPVLVLLFHFWLLPSLAAGAARCRESAIVLEAEHQARQDTLTRAG